MLPILRAVPLRVLHSSALPLLTIAPCGPVGELQPALSSLTNCVSVCSEHKHSKMSRNRDIYRDTEGQNKYSF